MSKKCIQGHKTRWKLGLMEGAPLGGTGEGGEPSNEELDALDLSEFGIDG